MQSIVRESGKTRWTVLAGALGVSLTLCAGSAMAQHGGGGGMGGPPMGGMGGSRGGGMRGGISPRESFVPQRPSGAQLGLPGRWWDDKKNAKILDLRSDQQKKMDDIFEANKSSLVTLLGNVQHEQLKLQAMSPQDLQDQGKVFAQIDRVAAAKTELEKQYALTLMLIRQQLQPEQLNKLDAQIANLR